MNAEVQVATRTVGKALTPPPDDIGIRLARIYLRILQAGAREAKPAEEANAAPEDLPGPGAAHEVTTDEQP